jgi:hypothetical protein
MIEYDKRKSHTSSKLHVIYISKPGYTASHSKKLNAIFTQLIG